MKTTKYPVPAGNIEQINRRGGDSKSQRIFEERICDILHREENAENLVKINYLSYVKGSNRARVPCTGLNFVVLLLVILSNPTVMAPIGKIVRNRNYLEIQVPAIYFEEEGIYYAAVPALDITGYGNSEKEAQDSLELMIDEFIKDAQDDNILEKELVRMGWKRLPEIKFPQLSDIISRNDQIKNIIDNKSVRTGRVGVNVPAFA